MQRVRVARNQGRGIALPERPNSFDGLMYPLWRYATVLDRVVQTRLCSESPFRIVARKEQVRACREGKLRALAGRPPVRDC
ncbi:MAG: hypothetical protein AB1649_32030, partial [Chloroflexota bacterium]